MNNEILKVRAEERMGQAINATQPLMTLILAKKKRPMKYHEPLFESSLSFYV